MTNPNPDDFVSFDRIIGKEIGVLNIIEDKKIVRKEVINSTLILGNTTGVMFKLEEVNLTCVCSSLGAVTLCGENMSQLVNDSFVKSNDLREEYCSEG